jgi:hypothetical protein
VQQKCQDIKLERSVSCFGQSPRFFLFVGFSAWFSFHALGAYVHILLLLAIIAFLIRVIQGRNPL